MAKFERNYLIKSLQAELPRGGPFDLAKLATLGVSSALAAHYARSGWLVRLEHGVYAFPNDVFDVYGALRFLQQKVTGLHIGGRSALARQGVVHNLYLKETLVLWGERRSALPEWFTARFRARYVSPRRLFDWPDAELPHKTLHSPPGEATGVLVSVPERAVLELLYEVGTRQNLEEARNIFDGMLPPRERVLGQLLSYCTSVKAVRLFLAWARETKLTDVDMLLKQYPIRTGSEKRWMTRYSDGSLLSLKPHG